MNLWGLLNPMGQLVFSVAFVAAAICSIAIVIEFTRIEKRLRNVEKELAGVKGELRGLKK